MIQKWFDLNFYNDNDDGKCNFKKSNTNNHFVHLIFSELKWLRLFVWLFILTDVERKNKFNPSVRKTNHSNEISNGKGLKWKIFKTMKKKRETIITIWFSPTFWHWVSFADVFFANEFFVQAGDLHKTILTVETIHLWIFNSTSHKIASGKYNNHLILLTITFRIYARVMYNGCCIWWNKYMWIFDDFVAWFFYLANGTVCCVGNQMHQEHVRNCILGTTKANNMLKKV